MSIFSFHRAVCLTVSLLFSVGLAAASATAQQAEGQNTVTPLPLTTPAQPTISSPTIQNPAIQKPTVPVIGAEPAPPQGMQSLPPAALPPAVNQQLAPVGLAAPAPQREFIHPETESRPVVVELYTSQGCSSCPLADTYIGQLARRKDVLALSFHVDYWDYIGWKDKFADPAYVGRQRAYAMTLGHHMVYTPQVVVAGSSDAQGADRATIEQRIREAKARQRMYPLEVARDPQSGNVVLELPEAPLPVPATIWLMTYQYRDEAAIASGENTGLTLDSFNTVRSLQKVAIWNGHAATLTLELNDKAKAARPNGCAIVANLADYGPIVGAVAFDFGDAW
ncbi:MAG TPA: DUF1223 domain-containing protein [Dongiaceae bacterium]|jgi:hypothetical protein